MFDGTSIFLEANINTNSVVFENCSKMIKINSEFIKELNLEFRTCSIEFISEVLKNITGNVSKINCDIYLENITIYFQDILYMISRTNFSINFNFNQKVICPTYEKIYENYVFRRPQDYINIYLPENIIINNKLKPKLLVYQDDDVYELTEEIMKNINNFDIDFELTI